MGTNDYYSGVVMHQKAQRTSEFFDASKRVLNTNRSRTKCVSSCWVQLSRVLRFFHDGRGHLSARAKNTPKSSTWRDIQSLLTTIYFFILIFVYSLICRRRDLTFKIKIKIINIFFKIQFLTGIANLQMLKILKYKNLKRKLDNLGFKK